MLNFFHVYCFYRIRFTTRMRAFGNMFKIRAFARLGMVLRLFLAGALIGPALAQQPASPAPMTVPEFPAPQSATSAATPSSPAVPRPISTPAEGSDLVRLGAGDLIDVTVYNVPEMATKARVGNNGDVYLPLIDYVHVADLTVEEAQIVIEKRLDGGGFVRSPHVTIFVDEANSQGVTMLGEVARPGIYPALGDRKLYDMISGAGGFTPVASRRVSILHRNQNQATTLSLPRNLTDDLSGNVSVVPGDTINVPKAPIVYVVGDVGRPAGLIVDNGTLTVLQAIALTGGTNRTAKLNSVRIVRKQGSNMTEMVVPLKKMLRAKAPDITLQADDILFVPVSGARIAATRTIDAMAQVATGMTLILAHP